MYRVLTLVGAWMLTITSAVCIRADDSRAIDAFFKSHCVRCHNERKSKGNFSLTKLDRDLAAGADVEDWERVLQMLESGAMPPEDEPHPKADERSAVIRWLHAGLKERERLDRERTAQAKTATVAKPTTRRLTNVEYENTMRDLLGFELKLSHRLPKDPVKAYRFNNTADFMRLGPEQFELYLECARRALASAIVDPGKPEPLKSRQEW